jgi:hypothetical protein
MNIRHAPFQIALLLLVVACSTSEPEPAPDGGDGGSDRCTFPDFAATFADGGGRCPSDCDVPVSGMKVDAQRRCTVSQSFFGCMACPQGCGGAPEGPCYRHVPTGQIARIPTYAAMNDPAGSQNWVSCTSQENAGFALPACP